MADMTDFLPQVVLSALAAVLFFISGATLAAALFVFVVLIVAFASVEIV